MVLVLCRACLSPLGYASGAEPIQAMTCLPCAAIDRQIRSKSITLVKN